MENAATLTPTSFRPEGAPKLVYFMLVKTTNLWLQMPPTERMQYLDERLRPILVKWPSVRLRYFDAEAFTTRCTDVMMWECGDIHAYQSVIKSLRETLFWGTYFEIVEIIPAIEDAYADYYGVERL
jgi:hypothetical protein